MKRLWFGMVIMLMLAACVRQTASTEQPIQTVVVPIAQPAVTVTPAQLAGPEIHQIQGAAHLSPMLGETVENVTGVVTALRADGFYMQGLNPDDDPATSEGIFVFTRFPPRVKVGDWVSVSGLVEEFYPGGVETGYLSVTELKDVQVVVLASGQVLPAVVVLGKDGRAIPDAVIEDDGKNSFDADLDGMDFYESMESMLVQVNGARVVGSSSAYKEIAVVTDGGEGASILSGRGALVVRETDFNPERILLDDSLRSLPVATVGDWFDQPIVGILDYSFGNYKIQPLSRLTVKAGGLTPEVARPATTEELTIVSYNVENLDARDDEERFEQLAVHLVNNLGTPDIVVLVEVQDGDGPLDSGLVDGAATYQRVVEAVEHVGGPMYDFREIAPENNRDGGEVGGNIRVGFLFRVDRVQFVDRVGGDAMTPVTVIGGPDGAHLSISPGRVDPQSPAFVDSRKPLVGEFLWDEQRLIVIANHFNSKSGDTALYGDFQPPILLSETQRIQQATTVNRFVADVLAVDPEAWVVVAGDLNDFQFSMPVRVLKGEILTDLIETLPPQEQYTYLFEGNAQVLDHVLVSPALQRVVTEVDVIHLNAEFVAGERLSDHDPVLVRVRKP